MAEGEPVGLLYVVASGAYSVTRQGEVVATIVDPGAVIGEVSALLDTVAGATVTATTDGELLVVDEPMAFLTANPPALEAIARLLAARLNGLVAYLADLKTQYGGADGNLGLVDEVVAQLTFGEASPVEPGSERDPDPLY